MECEFTIRLFRESDKEVKLCEHGRRHERGGAGRKRLIIFLNIDRLFTASVVFIQNAKQLNVLTTDNTKSTSAGRMIRVFT